MPAATVLIPTHNHAQTLYHAVASVQAQTVQDFELFIVGDGVSDATRSVVSELARGDARIRFFDFPKGPRKGERLRHEALREASGRFVAYLGDDDCWMPNHLHVLGALLADVDFGHTLHVGVTAQKGLYVYPADLSNQNFRKGMLTELGYGFDFTFAGHTLDAYRRLPYGWRTTPAYFPFTDLYMWRQFLAQPWCRARSSVEATCISTQTHRRPYLSEQERADDLAYWRAEAARPEFEERLRRLAADSFATDKARAMPSGGPRLLARLRASPPALMLKHIGKAWRPRRDSNTRPTV